MDSQIIHKNSPKCGFQTSPCPGAKGFFLFRALFFIQFPLPLAMVIWREIFRFFFFFKVEDRLKDEKRPNTVRCQVFHTMERGYKNWPFTEKILSPRDISSYSHSIVAGGLEVIS